MEKVKVIILGTGKATKKFIECNTNNKWIDIIGVVLDTTVPEEGRHLFVNDLKSSISTPVNIMDFSEESFRKCDVIFLPEYRKIIPEKYTSKFIMINCHGGILPKWRGSAANAWAIMNGEKEIGFSIHRVSDELDGGEIYYVKHIPISEEETYSDVHDNMIKAIASDVPKVIYDIIRNGRKGENQKGAHFAYCTKFSPEMGELRNFCYKSEYYVNLHRCMARPLGTGLFIYHKGKKIMVDMVEHGRKYNSVNYIGTPGKIVNMHDDQIWIKTKDNTIIVSKMSVDGEKINIEEYFSNGMELGIQRVRGEG